LRDQKSRQDAVKAENDRKAAEAELAGASETNRLKAELRLRVAKERADQWEHRRQMIE